MNKLNQEIRKAGSGFLIFAISITSLYFLSPWIAFMGRVFLGRIASNFLFFWPQMAFLIYGIMDKDIGAAKSVFSHGQSVTWAIIMWLLVGFAFAWAFRRFKIRYKIIFVFPLIILVTIMGTWIMGLLGYAPYLEGP
jgi:hypothetical protein